MIERFLDWWNTGDPAPGEIALALLLIAVFVLIAEFGL